MRFAHLIAVAAGTAAVVQSTINSILVREVGFMGAAMVIGVVSTAVASLPFLLGLGPDLGVLADLPLYILLGGGLAGIVIIGGVGLTVSELGVAGGLSLFITVQIGLSVVFDHFGLLGVEPVPIDWIKLCGIILMVMGVQLVLR